MSKTYNFDKFDIVLIETIDSITLRYLNRDLFKVYQKTFTEFEINDICSIGLKNFIKICFYTIENYFINFTNNNYSSHLTITEFIDELQINFEYNVDLNFKFGVVLPLIENNNSINATDLYIKKLESDILNLKQIIDDNILLPTYSVIFSTTSNCKPNYQIYMPIFCDTITIVNLAGSVGDVRYNLDYDLKKFWVEISNRSNLNIHSKFKNHICDTLIISKIIFNDYNACLFDTLPNKIKKLIIDKCQNVNIYVILDKNILELELLEFIDCTFNQNVNSTVKRNINESQKEIIFTSCKDIPVINNSKINITVR